MSLQILPNLMVAANWLYSHVELVVHIAPNLARSRIAKAPLLIGVFSLDTAGLSTNINHQNPDLLI